MHKKRIYVPKSLRHEVLTWYHHFLCHPGATRLELTIAQSMTWPRLPTECRDFTHVCEVCQCAKKGTRKYGHLPAKVAEYIPWDKLCVDLIGPYTVTLGKKRVLILHAMTFIDPATGWFEIVEIEEKSSSSMSEKLDTVWLNRYPRP